MQIRTVENELGSFSTVARLSKHENRGFSAVTLPESLQT